MSFHFFNAAHGMSLSTEGGFIARGAGGLRVDLGGARLLPGLINAHDHLQLNGALPRLKFREGYRNASEWIADITPRLSTDPCLLEHRSRPRVERLRAGGLKNLLSGVTTVLHHDPRDPVLDEPGFAVDAPAPGGWAHSLALDGDEAVRASHQATPLGQSWIIHAAEGIDSAAALEFDRLEALGCITPGTLLVHGLSLSAAQQDRLVQAGSAVVWCPGSNLHLFGRTLDPEGLFQQGRLLLGSDSRISGGRDLLAELALVQELTGWHDERLETWLTEGAARLLGLSDRGRLEAGLRADLIALPPGLPLAQATRADLRLVVVAGQALYADADLGEALQLAPVRVDGRAKALARHLFAPEPGLELLNPGTSV
ncbi:amidohydrolase family protein [Roseateles sp.]|uniref:amidohydrolase family protein n=1 Tax=Roseateles sp. TaxID=1971397 RepID=UPI003D0D52F4